MAMRGLTVFITDIRQCTSKEAEQRRIEKELGNIRQKFSQPNIGGYQLKKYIWKIIYMMMLGVDIDFGHMEAVSLISSQKYSEKNVGYVACTLMLTEQNDILRLIIQSIKNDLNSKNENFQCLALTCIANVGGEEFAETLAIDVQRLLVSGSSRDMVKKKAALCLLRLFKKYPEVIQNEAWAPRFIDMLESSNIGVVLSVMSLLLGLAAYEPEHYVNAIPKCIDLIEKLHNRDIERGYVYYSQGCPWLQVKILRFLQLFPSPDTPTLYARLLGLLAKIIDEGCKEPIGVKPNAKAANKSNAIHAILFETINLIMHYNLAGSHDLLAKSITLLGNCITVADTNLRALSLETMAKLSKIPGTLDAIKTHQQVILTLLKDNDVYLKKRALDLLFNMCDKTNSADIVMELLTALADSEYAIREEMALKIAILAENFAMDDRWYIDVILKLIQLAGDFVCNDIWYRVIQVVTNNDNLQAYAAQAVYDALSKPKPHETLTKLGGYILGEFGHLIEEHASSKSQFVLLHSRFASASFPIQALLLSTFMKMWNLYPHLKPVIAKVVQPLRSFIDDELQQRAVEYSEMLGYSNQELMSAIWEMMPAFPERTSVLLQHLRQSEEQVPAKVKHGHSDSDDNEEDEADDDVDDDDDDDEVYSKSSSLSPSFHKNAVNDDDADNDDTTESESSSRSPSPHHKVQDLLSMDDLLGGVKADPKPFPEQDTNKVRQVLLSNKGVVYESESLQIGAIIQVEGTCHAKMILYFGNKEAMTPLTDLNLEIAQIKGIRVQKKPAQPFTVNPKAQEPLYLLWQVAQPFPAQIPAVLTLSYNGAPVNIRLLLPVAINLFSSPNTVSGQGFVELWTQYSANEHQFILKSFNQSPFVPTGVIDQIVSGLRYHIVPDVDPSGRSIVACSNFHHLVANGMTSQEPMLIRVELKNDAMRVTCRSTHHLLTDAIESVFRAIF